MLTFNGLVAESWEREKKYDDEGRVYFIERLYVSLPDGSTWAGSLHYEAGLSKDYEYLEVKRDALRRKLIANVKWPDAQPVAAMRTLTDVHESEPDDS